MAEAKTHRGTVVRNFYVTNGNARTNYTAGDTVTFDAGEFVNYERAGLVSKPSEAAIKSTDSKADDKA